MLLLFEHIHGLVDFEHFARPLVLIKGLVEESGEDKLGEHFDESALTLGVVVSYLFESEAVVQGCHFKI